MRVYKSAVGFANSPNAPPLTTPITHSWSQKLSGLLEEHPYLIDESDDEDSQEVGGDAPDPEEVDFSLSSSDGEEEEEEQEVGEGVAGGVVIPEKSTRNVVVRKKPKVGPYVTQPGLWC